ncbi:MAG: DUF4007 family protein, partial [Chitinophagales bacterium]
MAKFTFSGHDTFHCRHFWLKKGYDFVKADKKFNSDTAVVDLGVGKNMVNSIRFWLKSFYIVEENYQNTTKIADYIFGDKGVDPYLEDVGTLWLLHYHLITKEIASTYSLVFNQFRKERIEFNKEHLFHFLKRFCKQQNFKVSPNSLKRDIGVFIRNYLLPKSSSQNVEDDFSGLLIELGLLREIEKVETGGSNWYKIEASEKEDLPIEVLLFSILDNPNWQSSMSFISLLNDKNSIGVVYALTANGLMSKIEELTQHYSFLVYKEDAGVRELQFKEKPNKWEILQSYYQA